MRNIWKKWLGISVSICLLLSVALPAYAAKAPAPQELHITSLAEFLDFAEHCRLDSNSQNLTVYLETDIDLTNVDFAGIPIFCGTFYGNQHTISGLSMEKDGSVQGLFRYVSKGAVLQDLAVVGDVLPEGSRRMVGGIVGSNEGTIRACNFTGRVSGNERVGGIVGCNQVAGIVEGCQMSGSVEGDHFSGGIAGENLGLVRDCTNDARINGTADENSVSVSDVTWDALMGTESAHTVTDIGGIAGSSSGVIRACNNKGTVGYQHMGYNVGGIAGSQKGLIAECTNMGEVYGRKEVGGIVGQIEPIPQIEYSKDTLQMLQQQLKKTASLADQASADAQNSAASIQGQVDALQGQAGTALDAINQLVPDRDNPDLPDEDSILAAKNTLSSSVSAMHGTMDGIATSTKGALDTMSGNIQAMAKQMESISKTLANAPDNLGGSMKDVSDADTEKDLTGKVMQCKNAGNVEGDLNAGGIAGAIAMENDLDPEDDLQFSGSRSLNFKGELRAVICDSENSAQISAKKRQVGGIVGWMSCGLVKNCVNTGALDAESARNVGGIAGNSDGFIRGCSAKCRLSGDKNVGGIAGSAVIATDCRSVVEILNSSEKTGAVLGQKKEGRTEVEKPVANNAYLVVEQDVGGIDGVSYADLAQPMEQDAFMQLPALPQQFQNSTLTFIEDDGTANSVTVPLGQPLEDAQIPTILDKSEHSGYWEGLEELDLSHIYFDQSFTAAYEPYRATMRSEDERESGKAILLAEGTFCKEETIYLEAWEDDAPVLQERHELLESWKIPALTNGTITRLRVASPDGVDASCVHVLLKCADGTWKTAETTVSGSYLVFPVEETDAAFCLVRVPAPIPWAKYGAAAGGAVLVLLVLGVAIHKKHKKKQPATVK